jgi:hypothetical protein
MAKDTDTKKLTKKNKIEWITAKNSNNKRKKNQFLYQKINKFLKLQCFDSIQLQLLFHDFIFNVICSAKANNLKPRTNKQ